MNVQPKSKGNDITSILKHQITRSTNGVISLAPGIARREAHRRIFRHIAQLIEAGRPSDIVTVFESMDKAGEAEQAGGLEYLGRIANNKPSLSRLDHYVDLLKPEAA